MIPIKTRFGAKDGERWQITNPRKPNRLITIVVILVVISVALIGTIAFTVFRSPTPTLTSSSADPRLRYLTMSPYYSSFPVLGLKNASITIFQFGDFQCPTCDNWFKTQEPQLLQKLIDTGKAKLIWRDFFFIGPDSYNASRAAYAAGEQGKFWQFYDLLYANQGAENSGWASSSNLIGFARSLGLNMTEFKKSFVGGGFESLINSNKEAVSALGISASPTFFIVGPHGQVQEIGGPQPESVFESTINSMS